MNLRQTDSLAPAEVETADACVTRRVLDTNIVLDLWVFDDPASAA